MKVCVVGGGVVGLATAEALLHRGGEVVVVDRARCGMGASHGNAGWITPALSAPLAAPGMVPQALRWMADRSSPFLLRPVFSVGYVRWLYRFWRSATPARYAAGMAALVALGQRALPGYAALIARGVDVELHRDGLLFVGLTERAVAREHHELIAQQANGYREPVQLLDGDAARTLEPSLSDAVDSAVHAPGEAHVRPERLVAALLDRLRAAGVEILEGAGVAALARRGAGWCVRLTGGQDLRCDRVVLAAGRATGPLLGALGVDLPIEGAKGYSVTYADVAPRPAAPLYLLEAKVGLSPFSDGVRLAGTLELGSRSDAVDGVRVGALASAAARYLRQWKPSQCEMRWAGFRPLLPDGLPAIGRVPGHGGLYVATGHGMLGVTLAAATAELLAPVVLDVGAPDAELALAPFSVARFTRG